MCKAEIAIPLEPAMESGPSKWTTIKLPLLSVQVGCLTGRTKAGGSSFADELSDVCSSKTFQTQIARGISARSIKRSVSSPGQTATQISVVIPTCRQVGLLQNCLEALVEQTFDRNFYEIIVVSDGHDEETRKLVNSFKQFHPGVFYLHLSEKKGPAAARNLGWQRAWGKLIAFTDDDCLPHKSWLATLYKNHQGQEEIAYSGKLIVPLSSSRGDYDKNVSDPEAAEFVTANCCCTKIALEKVEGFDERFSIACSEDSDLEFKLIQKNIPVIKVEEAIVIHPVRPARWGISIKEQKKGVFNALLYKKFPGLYRKKIHENTPWKYYMIAVAFTFFLLSLFLHAKWLAAVFFLFWLALTGEFIERRLSRTATSVSQVVETVVTSFVIPFVSVYWQIYGAIKFNSVKNWDNFEIGQY